MTFTSKALLTVVFSLMTGVAIAALHANYVVGQQGKAFTQEKLTVKVGETVAFVNNDSFFHNVFCLFPGATFDLGSYPKGERRTVTFDQKGMIEVMCAIHPEMYMGAANCPTSRSTTW